MSIQKASPKAHLHFVGIDGIGMSALAEILVQDGYNISGCDTNKNSANLDRLKKFGCTIYHEHDVSHTDNIHVLVYSTAISCEHPERISAQQAHVPQLHRSAVLQSIIQNKESIAITGSHGKTTTTSLLAHIFLHAHYDPTIVAGGIINSINSNAHYGLSDLCIVEADESDKSLHALNPSHALITNTDTEHLNVYNDLNDIQKTFISFAHNTPHDGIIYLGIDDAPTLALKKQIRRTVITFGEHNKSDFYAHDITYHRDKTSFFINNHGPFMVPLPGKHNMLNALGAISIALNYEISSTTIQEALATFSGVKRRFEFKGVYHGAQLYDDYAHHPTELDYILKTAQHFAPKRLFAAFQPQRYSRTHSLWHEFVESLACCEIEHLFLVDIYPASEQPIAQITSKRLVDEIKKKNKKCKITYMPSYEALFEHMKKTLQQDDTFISLGAGKLFTVTEQLAQTL